MVHLTRKVLILILLIPLGYLVIWLLPVKSYLVYASVVDKHEALAKVDSPRVIFVGGSGLALGVDSELIEKKLGLPVINMGVNAGFGLRYMLNEVKPQVRAGDIVIVVPEYDHFFGVTLEGDQNLLWVLQIYPDAMHYVTWKQYWNLAREVPFFMQARVLELFSTRPDPVYNRSAFNTHGDFVNHLSLGSPTNLPMFQIGDGETFNHEAIVALQEFEVDATAVGATVFLLYPAVAQEFIMYSDNLERIQQVHQQVMANTSLLVPAEPKTYFFPNQYFFDTVYHLDSEGRQIRSKMIAEALLESIHSRPQRSRRGP